MLQNLLHRCARWSISRCASVLEFRIRGSYACYWPVCRGSFTCRWSSHPVVIDKAWWSYGCLVTDTRAPAVLLSPILAVCRPTNYNSSGYRPCILYMHMSSSTTLFTRAR